MAATGRTLALVTTQRHHLLRPCSRCISVLGDSKTSTATSQSHGCGAAYHVRWYSSNRKGFISGFIDNVRSDFAKNKEMKENLKKFREEAEKLEQSEALKKARQKYESIEAETTKGSDVFKKQLSSVSEKLKETIHDAEKSDFGKRGKELAEGIGKTATKAAESVTKGGEQIAQSQVFKSVATGVKAVKSEIDEVTLARGQLYRAPEKLRKRDDGILSPDQNRTVEANEEATGIVMHKDSKWYQSWQNFKDNNQYVTKLFDLKMKYDESDHVLIRATRTVTDKVQELFGGVFSKTEMSEVLTEICKMDPHFDKELFIRDCRDDIIPNVLEAILRGDLEILQDWCHEAIYNTLAHPVKEAAKVGCKLDSKVLDISRVDIIAGKMMEQGPVLVITFHAQQIMCVRDSKGVVAEGDPEKITRVDHVWALCRDQNILNPKAAWRVVDLSMSRGQAVVF